MKRILILASNPKRDLALDREIRDLESVVKRSKNRDDLEVRLGSAVRPEDLQELLLEWEPQIVHFCGHGTGEQGLVLQNAAGKEQLVSTSALSSLFELFAGKVDCVLLNACYSEVQANAISQHINYVVGMSQAIRDDAAIAFATGFYRALGYARSVEESFRFGCNAIQLVIPTTLISPSPNSEQTRKLQPVSLIEAEQVIIPEYLKPALKIRQTLNARLEQFAVQPAPAIEKPSHTEQIALQNEVHKALEQEGVLKQYRDRVRTFLADRVLTPVEEFQLKRLAEDLELAEAETTAILQEEKQKIRQSQDDYRQILIRYVQQGAYPFSPHTLTELKILQQELGLSDTEVNDITTPITGAIAEQQQEAQIPLPKQAILSSAKPAEGIQAQIPFRSQPVAGLPRMPVPSVQVLRHPKLLIGAGFTTAIALVCIFLVKTPQPEQKLESTSFAGATASSAATASDLLGRVWTMEENGWRGEWLRKGNTNEFDATWTSLSNSTEKFASSVSIKIEGNYVVAARHDIRSASNTYTGPLHDCTYTGTLDQVTNKVLGQNECLDVGYEGDWEAKINH